MAAAKSLDEIISAEAVEFADHIRAAAAIAADEAEVRMAAVEQLAFIQKEAGIKLESHHEFTVASGRVDSVYSPVIVEYKNPKSPADKIGPKADSPGSKKVVKQIKDRFHDPEKDHSLKRGDLFGVGLDGNHFIFVRFRDGKWDVQDPVEVNRHSAERFLWAAMAMCDGLMGVDIAGVFAIQFVGGIISRKLGGPQTQSAVIVRPTQAEDERRSRLMP